MKGEFPCVGLIAMEKSGPVSRDFPSGESSSVLQTIKVEETSAEEGADRTQSEFPYGMERHSGGGIDRREDLNSACDRSAMSMEKSSDNHGNVGGMGPPRTVPRRSSQPRLVDHSVSLWLEFLERERERERESALQISVTL